MKTFSPAQKPVPPPVLAGTHVPWPLPPCPGSRETVRGVKNTGQDTCSLCPLDSVAALGFSVHVCNMEPQRSRGSRPEVSHKARGGRSSWGWSGAGCAPQTAGAQDTGCLLCVSTAPRVGAAGRSWQVWQMPCVIWARNNSVSLSNQLHNQELLKRNSRPVHNLESVLCTVCWGPSWLR